MAESVKAQNVNKRAFENHTCLLKVPLTTQYNQVLVDLLSLLDVHMRLYTKKRETLETPLSRAIALIKSQKCRVNFHYAKNLGIPEEYCDMIRAYDETGTINEAANLLTDEEFNTIRSFEKVYGVGSATARKWWEKGYRSLDDVTCNVQSLPVLVQNTLKIASDLRQPIFRQDAEEIASIIQKALKTIDHQATVTLVGSYRREKEELGDIDILICNHSEKFANADLLSRCIAKLSDQGSIKQILLELTIPKMKRHWMDGSINSVSTTLALIQPTTGFARQADIRVVSKPQLAIAKFMSTGSARFLYSLIKLAESKGFILSPTGMFDTRDGSQLLVEEEEDVFKSLNIEYIEPRYRHH